MTKTLAERQGVISEILSIENLKSPYGEVHIKYEGHYATFTYTKSIRIPIEKAMEASIGIVTELLKNGYGGINFKEIKGQKLMEISWVKTQRVNITQYT